MAENPTAEISQETWRFFNQMKTYPREPIGEVIDRFTERLHSDELREQLADLEHHQWGHWTRHMMEFYNEDNRKRWERQSHTAYKNLSDGEKDSDRGWADKVLAILRGGTR